jgi:hypothetical protein
MGFPDGLDIARGLAKGLQLIPKFGHNAAVGTSFVPICRGGIYRTPQVSGAKALRVAAGNAADTAAGLGAREVSLQGLNQAGELVTEAVATNGATASLYTTTLFLRLFRVWVSASGTYASATAGSHTANIVIQDNAPLTWTTLVATGFPRAQSQIGAYSVPLGYTAFITEITPSIQSTKLVDLTFFTRENILQTAPPYSAMRVKREAIGIDGHITEQFPYPLGPFPALTDIGFMAKVSAQTADVSIDFNIVLARAL